MATQKIRDDNLTMLHSKHLCMAWLALAPLLALAQDDERKAPFQDPFLQATQGVSDCPTPQAPKITPDELRAQSHYRAERGVSCYQSGRCRLPNAYLYDAEIVPRVKKAILADGRFADTTVWIEGQRRWVWLKGCVHSQAQAEALEQLVRNIDDVEAVMDELTIWVH